MGSPSSTSDRDGAELRAIAKDFADFASEAFARLPLYRRLAQAASGDLDVVRRLMVAPAAQRLPNLLLASVHDVLLAGEDDVLADWYPSVAAHRGGSGAVARPVGIGADDPWPHFRRLAMTHPGVAERLATRTIQTNEVGRCAIAFPALFDAAIQTSSAPSGGARPLGLVEVGSSAGLNLRYRGYGFRYARPDGSIGEQGQGTYVESVGPGSRLLIHAKLRGRLVPPLPEAMLPVASAIGLDQHPLAVGDIDDARWLVACHWPEDLDRLVTLRAALEQAKVDPPLVVAGDAVDDVAQHLLAVPAHALPVAVATWTLSYLSVARQIEFLAVLDQVGAQRDVALVFAEQPERVSGLPVPGRPDGQPDGRATAVVRVLWREGERTAARLADAHPHGRWLEWLVA